MKTRDVMEVLYTCVYTCIEDIVLPTGKNLLFSLKICALLCCISVVSTAFGIYTFLDWRGTIIALVIILIECFLERRNNSEILGYYSNVKLLFEQAERRQERPSGDESVDGDSTASSSSGEEDVDGGDDSIQSSVQ